MSKGQEKRPQAYRDEQGRVLMVETIGTGKFVVHFPEGPERRGYTEVKETMTHLGNWNDYQKALPQSGEVNL